MNVKIGIDKDVDKAQEIINNYFIDKKVKIEEEDYDNMYLFDISLIKKSWPKKDFNTTVTHMILDVILNIYSEGILYKKISKQKNNLKRNEKEEIVKISRELLLDKENFKVEKEYIFNQIKEYIKHTPFILVDGFVQFRLKEFDFFINLVIEKGIEEFTAEKEYKEFIKILQYFVEVQEPKYDLINLFFEKDNYKLLDKKGNIIDNDFFSEIVAEIDSQGISKSDLLVSSLIVIAPKKLIIHLDEEYKDADIVKIITNVFQDRVQFCLGCKECDGQIKIKRGK